MRLAQLVGLVALPGLLPGLAGAQTLTLADALRRADTAAYANRIATAEAGARAGEADLALRAVLPALRVEGGYARTTEPLGAFGFTLQQRAVTPEAFDPARLNNPEAIGNVGSAIVLEQPIFNADALYGRRAAARGRDAARAAEVWAHTGTAVDVIRAYYGAVLATERAAALDTAVRAARAHERSAASQYRNGLATRSDVLLASVRAGQVEADLVAARGGARLAHAQLAVALGAPSDTNLALPERLPDTAAIARIAALTQEVDTLERADVRAAHLALAAAEADRQRAKALYLPRVNTFGRLDWNSAGTPFGGQEAWTAGIMVSWSPFNGGVQLAEGRMTTARREAAAASADAAEARGRLERQDAQNALEVALTRMAITGQAVAQSGEAHRIVARKYDGGLATAVELFDAAAEETAARLGYADARYQAIVSAAERRRSSGLDLAPLTTLDALDGLEP